MKADVTAEISEVRRLRPADQEYPARVLELPGRPRVLRSLGDLDVLQTGPALAVIGTRTPTDEVLQSARRVVELSVEFGMVVVSGIAPGVDVAVHEASLEMGLKTIAIPGCGLDMLMSSDRGALAHRIVEAGGLLLSPFPRLASETSERRWWRNRLIAAICHGLVMVASEPEGGAIEAQRWARQLERRLIEPSDDEPSTE